ncbi:hypothetical protein NL108_017524 [Boleophthalmus pectinirostris]|uniref:dispanin subfamily A member 2b-like n=1 Tax=Boleophthalmus pectinirostris TaxID=150288 RepID=UPI00242F3E25|nr:dispanin subfamily A member 2b-like [Boleophthalmus pectinirostris]KAJ0069943.1 hypothetical protein NL108_017524 [Boleophthalmus pectinirostris]
MSHVPPEHFQLQGGQVHPNVAHTSVQYTAVNVNQAMSRDMPRDHFVWSLWSFICCNPLCLGLAALIYSVKARDRKVVGDIEAARSHGSTARDLNIAATVITSLIVVIVILIYAVLMAQDAH